MMTALMTGCTSKSSTTNEVSAPADSTYNPFEQDEANALVLGSMSHGFSNPQLDEQGKILPLEYNGGELEFKYSVRASGKAKNVGFLVFLDGKPQPYKIKSSDAPYQYMHLLELEGDDVDTPFTFVFTPVTGKKGDTLHINITSVYNPGFMPDMKKTTSYGGYQTTLEAGRALIFAKDADPLEAPSIPQHEILGNARLSTEPITQEMLDRYSVLEKVDMETLDKKVYSELQIDGAVRQDNFNVQSEGTLQVSYKLFGHPGIRYRSTFYINHQAVAGKDGTYIETTLTKGDAAVINAEIKLEQLEDFSTFYIVSVPVNADDFPDDVVVLEKTPSLLLYK